MFARLWRRPLVSVCIPAWRSQAFIAETVESALAQTISDIEVVIANDAGHETPALDSYARHDKVRVRQGRRRLGWVGNSNRALSLARGRYFMVLPHDDCLDPGYLEACLDVLEASSEVFAAYCDIDIGGRVLRASEAAGSLEDRVKHVMCNLYNGYSYRALMPRRRPDWAHLRMRGNPPTDIAADTVWMVQQACLGELRRVPRVLYRKRYHGSNTHTAWRDHPRATLQLAWRNHCEIAARVAQTWIGRDAAEALLAHRLDARRVFESPKYMKAAMANDGLDGDAASG